MLRVVRFLPLVFLLLTVTSRLDAQVPNFVTAFSNCFGGSDLENFFGGEPALDGGYLMTGLSNSTDGDINPALAYDTSNIFVVKVNALGQKEWAKTFGGNLYDKARYVMQDADSNILVVGGTFSVDGDIDTTHGNSELFVLKLDPQGNKIWMKTYGGTAFESGRMIKQLASGDYIVVGYSTSKNGDVPANRGIHDGWLLKLDVNGNIIWSQTYGGSGDDRMRGVAETPDGGFMIFGSSSSNDDQITGNHGGDDYWIGKVDSLGNHLWSKVYGGPGDELAFHITQTPTGNFLLTGCTFAGGGDVTNFMGFSDGWLAEVDTAGNLLWQRTYGGSGGDRLMRSIYDAQGRIVTFGFSQSDDYDLAGTSNGPSNNYWLIQLDSAHQVTWNYLTGGTAADLGTDMLFNAVDSSFILMGESNSSNGTVLNPHGDYDFWIVKVAQFTGVPELPAPPPSWNAFFDSADQSLVIDSQKDQQLQIYISDMVGRIIGEPLSLNLGRGLYRTPMMMSRGMYLAHITNGPESGTLKFTNAGHY